MSTKCTTKTNRSSGNVFADLGFPNPEKELLKAKLTLAIYRIIRERGLTQAEAGKVLGIQQPHVSALMRNRAGTFSVEQLMDFLAALGQDVKITVKSAARTTGRGVGGGVREMVVSQVFRRRGRDVRIP
jgi:predicted XRE-type DNA-binding protein